MWPFLPYIVCVYIQSVVPCTSFEIQLYKSYHSQIPIFLFSLPLTFFYFVIFIYALKLFWTFQGVFNQWFTMSAIYISQIIMRFYFSTLILKDAWFAFCQLVRLYAYYGVRDPSKFPRNVSVNVICHSDLDFFFFLKKRWYFFKSDLGYRAVQLKGVGL